MKLTLSLLFSLFFSLHSIGNIFNPIYKYQETKLINTKIDSPIIETFETEVCSEWVKQEIVNKDFFKVLDTMPVYNTNCVSLSLKKSNECTYRSVVEQVSIITERTNEIDSLIAKFPERIYFSFIVEKNCSISNVKIMRGENKILNNLVRKNVGNLDDFYTAGIKNNNIVRFEYTMGVKLK